MADQPERLRVTEHHPRRRAPTARPAHPTDDRVTFETRAGARVYRGYCPHCPYMTNRQRWYEVTVQRLERHLRLTHGDKVPLGQ